VWRCTRTRNFGSATSCGIRTAIPAHAVDWTHASTWEFLPLDDDAFPAVDLCREAGRRGGTAAAALNAANEEMVAAFLAGGVPFPAIVDTVARIVDEHDVVTDPDLAAVLDAEAWARARTSELVTA